MHLWYCHKWIRLRTFNLALVKQRLLNKKMMCYQPLDIILQMHGAVQQENRLSKAVDIILRHVENLKQAYDKERIEHEETRFSI